MALGIGGGILMAEAATSLFHDVLGSGDDGGQTAFFQDDRDQDVDAGDDFDPGADW